MRFNSLRGRFNSCVDICIHGGFSDWWFEKGGKINLRDEYKDWEVEMKDITPEPL